MKNNKRIIFHLGMPRTGTTHLQQTLRANDHHLLKEYGILYPSIWNEPYHSSFGGPIPKKPTPSGQTVSPAHEALANAILSGRLSIDDCVNYIETLVSNNDVKTLLISTEALTNVVCDKANHSFIEILRRLSKHHKISAVITLREYASFVESMYIQSIITWNERGNFDSYLQLRKTWFELLCKGIQQIKLSPFVDLTILAHNNISITSKFESILDCQLPPLNATNKTGEKPNLKMLALMYAPERYPEIANKTFQELYPLVEEEPGLFSDSNKNYTLYNEHHYKELFLIAARYAQIYDIKEYASLNINSYDLECKERIDLDTYTLSTDDIILIKSALH